MVATSRWGFNQVALYNNHSASNDRDHSDTVAIDGNSEYKGTQNDEQSNHRNNQGNILVTDDSHASLQVLHEILTTEGYGVVSARDGQSALLCAKEQLPDLILLDIKMPDMDGFEVCRQLKANPQTQDIPVIFISARNEIFDKVHAFQTGAVDYITKPFELEEVLVRVATQLSIRRLHAHLIRQNQTLTETLRQLQSTQKQLIESEKLAALGNLVAGIAHEINTPIGIGVTAASTVVDETQLIAQQFNTGEITRSSVVDFLQTTQECSELILNNLRRAADLVQSLKQVSADQIYLERRRFGVHTYLQEVLCSLAPTLKNRPHTIQIDGDKQIALESYPGAFSQIITNLIINSITHAYPSGRAGTLQFTWTVERERLQFSYADDGCGIAAHAITQIFEPFFTTARSQGSTGLGLHIVYTLVTKKMGGTIDCDNTVRQGTHFTMNFPLKAPFESLVHPGVNKATVISPISQW